MPETLTISPTIRRRYILGQQGLYPGRRWTTVLQAMQAGAVLQIDPLNVVARIAACCSAAWMTAILKIRRTFLATRAHFSAVARKSVAKLKP